MVGPRDSAHGMDVVGLAPGRRDVASARSALPVADGERLAHGRGVEALRTTDVERLRRCRPAPSGRIPAPHASRRASPTLSAVPMERSRDAQVTGQLLLVVGSPARGRRAPALRGQARPTGAVRAGRRTPAASRRGYGFRSWLGHRGPSRPVSRRSRRDANACRWVSSRSAWSVGRSAMIRTSPSPSSRDGSPASCVVRAARRGLQRLTLVVFGDLGGDHVEDPTAPAPAAHAARSRRHCATRWRLGLSLAGPASTVAGRSSSARGDHLRLRPGHRRRPAAPAARTPYRSSSASASRCSRRPSGSVQPRLHRQPRARPTAPRPRSATSPAAASTASRIALEPGDARGTARPARSRFAPRWSGRPASCRPRRRPRPRPVQRTAGTGAAAGPRRGS